MPIDTAPLELSLMEDQDIRWLNEYHQQVYEKLSPYLEGEEAQWLYQATRPVER